jgi:hypothetical protein
MKLFESWIQQHLQSKVQLDDLENRAFDYHDMLEAFEEGYHIAKDESRTQIQDVFNYWLSHMNARKDDI